MTVELYPTNLRSQAVGFCSMSARIFGLVVPFVANLAMFWKPLPMLVLGLPSLVAGASAYFLPETKGKELPQNMKDTTVKNLDTPLDEDQCENPIKPSWDIPYAVLGPVGKIKISQYVSYWYLKLNLK